MPLHSSSIQFCLLYCSIRFKKLIQCTENINNTYDQPHTYLYANYTKNYIAMFCISITDMYLNTFSTKYEMKINLNF